MKSRVGFVSNSSSSSFCICKTLMTDEQIKKLQGFTRAWKDDDLQFLEPYLKETDICAEEREEVYLSDFYSFRETKMYITGNGEVSTDPAITKFLDSIGVDKDNYYLEM